MDSLKATWTKARGSHKATYNKCELSVHATKYNPDGALSAFTYSILKRAKPFKVMLVDLSIPYDPTLPDDEHGTCEGKNNNRRLREVEEPGGHSVHTDHADTLDEAKLAAETFAENWADAAEPTA